MKHKLYVTEKKDQNQLRFPEELQNVGNDSPYRGEPKCAKNDFHLHNKWQKYKPILLQSKNIIIMPVVAIQRIS